MIIDVRHRSPTHHQPPMILSLSLSIPSHPLLRLPIASCARARATHVSAAFIFSTYFYTRLLGHGSQRVGVAPSRVVPSRTTVSSSSSFSLFKSPSANRPARCYLQSARNFSLFVDPSARTVLRYLSFSLLCSSQLYTQSTPELAENGYIHFSPLTVNIEILIAITNYIIRIIR